MRPLVIADFPTHYTAPLLARLHAEQGAQLVFLSDGATHEYWQSHLSNAGEDLSADTYVGHRIAPKFTVNPDLAKAVLKRDFDVALMELSGRVEIATTFIIAKLRKKPFLLWSGLWMHPDTPFHRLTWPLTRSLYRRTDAFVVYGTHVKRFLVGSGVKPDCVFVAEHSVDNDFYVAEVPPAKAAKFRRSVGAQDRPLILAVARLAPVKGLDDLIAAAAALRDLDPVVVVVGTGEFGPQLAASAAELGVDVNLVGAMPPSELPIAYAAADVFVMPSVTTRTIKECWGLAINEAMCQSLPVIATDAVGAVAGGLVVDDVTGIVVPEHGRAQLADALRRLLTSPEERERLGRAGRERVARNTHTAMAAVFAEAFEYAYKNRRR